ncbi:MAG: M1 family metallopeptidase [Candidatus Saccharimonadales bacterium]
MAKVARLIDEIVPERYELAIDVDMQVFDYTVQQKIDFQLVAPTKQLVFHAVRMRVSHGRLDGGIVAKDTEVNEADETVTFRFDEEIPAGQHILELKAAGKLNETLRGFYRSTYTDASGEKPVEKSLATTQFEAVHAREAFVCVDEPSAKSVFELKLTVPENLTAISNTNITAETVEDGRKTVIFAPTPKMSTYLVAYIIGEFEYLEKTTPEGVMVRTYATPGNTYQLEYALDVAVKTLSFYTEYFKIPYPLPKLDMIAVPDFAAGAMENWGAVTYRDTALLVDPEKTSLSSKQRVAEVVMHELAHQWFGNLVTMAWWDDLWLNEGFATWVSTLGLDKVFPEWKVWEEFAVVNVAYAMELDGLANTHPIQVPVEDPRSLDEIFDAISYSKGASIIDMLHHYLGAETFQEGLHIYLDRHKHGNTVTHDLWTALGEASGKPVDEVMSAWTSRPGYPIVSFDEGLAVQHRFFSSPREAKKAGKEQSGWPIPFGVILPGGAETEPGLLIEPADLPEAAMAADWFKPNPSQTSFFRTQYTPGMIEALSEPLRLKELAPKDRFGVVSDVFATTEAGRTDSVTAMKLIVALRDETDYVVWNAVSGGLGSLLGVMDSEEARPDIDAFGLWLVQPNVERLGWTPQANEPVFNTLMRPMVLQLAVRFDDPNVTAEAQKRYQAYLGGTELNPDLRSVVLYAAARHGGAKEFQEILERYRVEQSPQVKMSLLSTLGRFRTAKQIEQFLELGLSDDVRPQDFYMILAWGFRNRHGRDMTWAYLKKHWNTLVKRYGAGGHMLERFPVYAASGFATHEMAQEIKEFFTTNPHPAIGRPTAQAVESVELKADWRDRDYDAVLDFLRRRDY